MAKQSKPLWARNLKKVLAARIRLENNPELHSIGGRHSGLRNALSGELIRRGRNGGKTQGPKNVTNGSLETARQKYVELHGSLSNLGSSATRAAGGRTVFKLYGNIGPHTRWHVKRGVKKAGCPLCELPASNKIAPAQ